MAMTGGEAVHELPEGVPFVHDATIAPAETAAMVELLEHGEVEVLGLMPWSSNGTFLVEVRHDGDHAPAIYKPESTERPLWDFPVGLWRREAAAWELSEVLGFGLVPPTIGRQDGPLGCGSLQAFVPARFEEHYFTLRDVEDPAIVGALQALCVFDLVANATDRKGGHCLIDGEDRVWAIDNGLSFHTEFKLRTVVWDFADRDIPGALIEPLRELCDGGLPVRLARWLDGDEVDAVLARAAGVLGAGRFPHDPTGRRYPWPLV
jgi:uncharacterized repeat protein (TIGR03843 family)